MTVQEILTAHTVKRPWSEASRMRCNCGDVVIAETEGQLYALHCVHVAEVLDKHMKEREAAVIAGLAELLDEYQNSHDVAECAAPVEGETGRQAVIEKWESIIEEPAEWLRHKSKEHHENGFEHLRYVAYEAWQAGFESGWDEAKDPGAFVNDVWDAKTPNPYADEATS